MCKHEIFNTVTVSTFSQNILITTRFILFHHLNYSASSQAEIVKRLNGICAQVLPYLSQEVNHNTHTHIYVKLPLAL